MTKQNKNEISSPLRVFLFSSKKSHISFIFLIWEHDWDYLCCINVFWYYFWNNSSMRRRNINQKLIPLNGNWSISRSYHSGSDRQWRGQRSEVRGPPPQSLQWLTTLYRKMAQATTKTYLYIEIKLRKSIFFCPIQQYSKLFIYRNTKKPVSSKHFISPPKK